MDWSKLTGNGRLVAEQAVLTFRAVEQAIILEVAGEKYRCRLGTLLTV